ncbi:ABC transporter permease [uncultured Jatrophihabitans sp.]|uniref:ABC transporter permease n=1 Tax=uncultured Jatrophihabitans sp. TaxID=1610747 RepID=UPI0035CC2EC4
MTTMQRPAEHRRHPLRALATAEYRQFRRNTTLLYLGTLFPVGIPLLTFFVERHASMGGRETSAFELFALIALLLVQYYSVLSLVTTRRGEGVLKRLRTGEAADWQIQAAPTVPGAVLTVIGAVIVAAVVYGAGAPAPVNPVALVLAVVAGLVIFSLLALATSAVTKNAEAAQITSIPVITLAVIGLASIRTVLPDRLATVADWTPFAAVSDLVSLGTAGKPATAGKSYIALDFAGTFHHFGRPVATLVIWAMLSLVLARVYFRWDIRD